MIRRFTHWWLGFLAIWFWVVFLTRFDSAASLFGNAALIVIGLWHIKVMGVMIVRVGRLVGHELTDGSSLSTRLGGWIDARPRLAMTPIIALELSLPVAILMLAAE